MEKFHRASRIKPLSAGAVGEALSSEGPSSGRMMPRRSMQPTAKKKARRDDADLNEIGDTAEGDMVLDT